MIILILAIILIPAFCVLIIYNGLISKRNQVDYSFSSIDVQLKKRWNLVPNLVETVKAYASHEKDLFENIAKARSTAMESDQLTTTRLVGETQLSGFMPRLIGLAEDYPELKASEQFLNLQRNLTEIEAQISASRRAYNASILEYNNSIDMFPSSLIASSFNFTRRPFFEIPENETHAPHVKLS